MKKPTYFRTLIPTRIVTRWRMCIDYRKLNTTIRKDRFPLPFMDQMLERLTGQAYYCLLDGYNQIVVDPKDQEKTAFTCPFGVFAYRKMPFGLCNAPATFQRCTQAIFADLMEKCIEVFMDDFSEKCHFMVIVLGHKISVKGIEVGKAKVKVIEKLPPPTNVKGIRSFLGHARFYRRFIKDFSKIVKPLSNLLVKDTPFVVSDECLQAFDVLKKCLVSNPVILAPDWNKDFEVMCDASDYAIGDVLGQRREKVFHTIYYASKVLNDAQLNYATTEKEFLAIVYALEKFRSYLIGSKAIIREKQLLQRFFSQGFIGLLCLKMLIIMLEIVTSVKGRGLFQDVMRCPYKVFWRLKSLNAGANFLTFGTPRVLISDEGSHFFNSKLAKVLKHYGVRHKVAAPYHPQINGQAEVSNREIKKILDKTVASSMKDWSHKLDDALWAYRTAMETSMGLSPFQLVYGKTCHLPVEMKHKALWALKLLNFDPHETQSKRRRQMLELKKMRLHAYDSSKSYKEKVKFYHDRKLIKRAFNPWQQVIFFNSRLKLFLRKLESKWSGPFMITNVHPHGAVELMDSTASDPSKSWVVNRQRLKHYLRGEVERLSTMMKLVDP
ncbi:uncharacterized protein LOC106758332 [Vigna radiata var. radiata]|uniref:Uncharacterized protein LOC106758332 n=1 Tax=Vigna radiata var. radiata TaxID=3916 RepID=A0A1S3TSI7_VIGRR|nr:uncharacterized protein LOC106758332 [Vigna radiata var. radiata]